LNLTINGGDVYSRFTQKMRQKFGADTWGYDIHNISQFEGDIFLHKLAKLYTILIDKLKVCIMYLFYYTDEYRCTYNYIYKNYTSI